MTTDDTRASSESAFRLVSCLLVKCTTASGIKKSFVCVRYEANKSVADIQYSL